MKKKKKKKKKIPPPPLVMYQSKNDAWYGSTLTEVHTRHILWSFFNF
jgi:hypothetical protein